MPRNQRAAAKRACGCRGFLLQVGLGCLWTLYLAASAAAQAPAQAAPLRVGLALEADARCATRAAFAQRVQQRAPRIRFVEGPTAGPLLRLTLAPGRQRAWVAVLSLRFADGHRAERRLTADTCEAALDALALLLAMTLDEDATVTRPDDAGAQGGAGPDAPIDATPPTSPERPQAASTDPGAAPPKAASTEATSTEATSTEPTSTEATSTEPRSTQARSAQARSTQARSATDQTDSEPADGARADSRQATDAAPAASEPGPFALAHVAVDVSAQLLSGPAPKAMPGVGLGALLVLRGEGGPWAPALGLRLSHAFRYGLSEAGAEASFVLTRATLDVCPLGVTLSDLAVHACAAASAGRLWARGQGSYNPRTRAELWTSAGGALLVSVGLAGLFDVQAGLELAAPLSRYRFAFQPEVFHRVPVVTVAGQLGAGVRFP